MKDELGLGVILPQGKVSCPRGQDKPGGGGGAGCILPRGKVSPGTGYHVVSCPREQDTMGAR